jgi:hypothetical protein
MKFNFNDVIGVRFVNSISISKKFVNSDEVKQFESDIEFDDLLKLMEELETHPKYLSIHGGFGPQLQNKQAWEGKDYLGEPLDVDTYMIWTLGETSDGLIDKSIYRYKFPPSWIPLSAEKLNRDRIKKIDICSI